MDGLSEALRRRLGLDQVAASVEEEIVCTLVIQHTFSLSRPLAKFLHMVTLRTLAERRAEILGLAERYRTGDVGVFGSVARGEATENSDPSIPWRQIAGMRNILVHDYFRINQEIVWETVEKHLPPLKAEIEQILGGPPPS